MLHHLSLFIALRHLEVRPLHVLKEHFLLVKQGQIVDRYFIGIELVPRNDIYRLSVSYTTRLKHAVLLLEPIESGTCLEVKLIVKIKEYGPAELTPFRDHRQNNKLITLNSGFFDLELGVCSVIRRRKWVKDSEPIASELVIDVNAAVGKDGAYKVFGEA